MEYYSYLTLKERICFYIDLNTIPLEKIKNFKIKRYNISNAKFLLDKMKVPEFIYKYLFLNFLRCSHCKTRIYICNKLIDK